MSEPDSIQVLLKAARRQYTPNEADSNAVTELGQLLGGLPLALVHAGNYCDTSKITFSEYLKRLQSYRSQLMTMKPPLQLDRYSYSTYTSIKLSYSLLGEQARELLHLLSFFHPSSIRLDILRVASKHGFEIHGSDQLLPRDDQYDDRSNDLRQLLIPDKTWNYIYIDSLMNQLQSFSLISLSHSNGGTSITIHPLVQSCILDTLLPEECSRYFFMTSLVLSSCSYDEESPLFQHLSMHIMELDSRKMTIHPNHSSALAYILRINGSDEDAMQKCEKVRDECRRVNGDEHVSTLWSSYQIALCLYTMQRLEEAEELIRRVVEAQQRVLGEDDDEVVFAYQLLADIFRDQHKTEEGEKILKRLLALSESKNGPEHRTTLDIQWSLAANLCIQKRYSESEELSRTVLQMMKKALGGEEDLTLSTLNSLSGALTGQGKWAEAEDMMRELITKSTTIRGKHHPDTLILQYNLTLCLVEKGSFDEAKKIAEELIKAQEKILGKEHPDTIDSRNHLEYVIQQRKVPRPTNSQLPHSPSTRISSATPTGKSLRINRTREVASRLSSIPKRRSSRLEASRKTVRRKK